MNYVYIAGSIYFSHSQSTATNKELDLAPQLRIAIFYHLLPNITDC